MIGLDDVLESLPPPSPINLGLVISSDRVLKLPDQKRKKVAIIGFSRKASEAPWTDPAWEVWGLNHGWHWHVDPLKRWFRADRWFEMHPISAQSATDLARLRTAPVPVYMFEAYPEFPTAIKYPLDEVLTIGRRYFACTFAYQVALAVLEGFETIALYGVELGYGTPRERLQERATLEYWLGLAEGCGIEVIVPDTAHLLGHPFLYGYDYDEEAKWTQDRVDAMGTLAVRMALLEKRLDPDRAKVLQPLIADYRPEERVVTWGDWNQAAK